MAGVHLGPTSGSSLSRNFFAALFWQLFGSRLSAFTATKAAECDGRRILAIVGSLRLRSRLRRRQLADGEGPRVHVARSFFLAGRFCILEALRWIRQPSTWGYPNGRFHPLDHLGRLCVLHRLEFSQRWRKQKIDECQSCPTGRGAATRG